MTVTPISLRIQPVLHSAFLLWFLFAAVPTLSGQSPLEKFNRYPSLEEVVDKFYTTYAPPKEDDLF